MVDRWRGRSRELEPARRSSRHRRRQPERRSSRRRPEREGAHGASRSRERLVGCRLPRRRGSTGERRLCGRAAVVGCDRRRSPRASCAGTEFGLSRHGAAVPRRLRDGRVQRRWHDRPFRHRHRAGPGLAGRPADRTPHVLPGGEPRLAPDRDRRTVRRPDGDPRSAHAPAGRRRPPLRQPPRLQPGWLAARARRARVVYAQLGDDTTVLPHGGNRAEEPGHRRGVGSGGPRPRRSRRHAARHSTRTGNLPAGGTSRWTSTTRSSRSTTWRRRSS